MLSPTRTVERLCVRSVPAPPVCYRGAAVFWCSSYLNGALENITSSREGMTEWMRQHESRNYKNKILGNLGSFIHPLLLAKSPSLQFTMIWRQHCSSGKSNFLSSVRWSSPLVALLLWKLLSTLFAQGCTCPCQSPGWFWWSEAIPEDDKELLVNQVWTVEPEVLFGMHAIWWHLLPPDSR